MILHLRPSNFQEIFILSIEKVMQNIIGVSQLVEMPRPGIRYILSPLYTYSVILDKHKSELKWKTLVPDVKYTLITSFHFP